MMKAVLILSRKARERLFRVNKLPVVIGKPLSNKKMVVCPEAINHWLNCGCGLPKTRSLEPCSLDL